MTLLIVHESKKSESQFTFRRLAHETKVATTMRDKLKRRIESANAVEFTETSDTDPDEDPEVLMAESESETPFQTILADLPEDLVNLPSVENQSQLSGAVGYISCFHASSDPDGTIYAFKKFPGEAWAPQQVEGKVIAYLKGRQLTLLDGVNAVFPVGGYDLFAYQEQVFILNRRRYDKTLNQRKLHTKRAIKVMEEMKQMKVADAPELFQELVTGNLRYMRLIVSVEKVGVYRNKKLMQRLEKIATRYRWNIDFKDGKLRVTKENVRDVLYVLADKRVKSYLRQKTFDVDQAKEVKPREVGLKPQ